MMTAQQHNNKDIAAIARVSMHVKAPSCAGVHRLVASQKGSSEPSQHLAVIVAFVNEVVLLLCGKGVYWDDRLPVQ